MKEANSLTNTTDSPTLRPLKNSSKTNDLCLECGLCCNGVIFARGQLQPEDDVVRLQSLGLKLLPTRNSKLETRKFHQPCAAFDGCRCNIYADRPKYCGAFECLLLKSVKAGEMETAAALRIIQTARRRVARVKKILGELGDADEGVALSLRFRRMQRRFETGVATEENTDLYGDLTLAVHDLNMLLSGAFYPGS